MLVSREIDATAPAAVSAELYAAAGFLLRLQRACVRNCARSIGSGNIFKGVYYRRYNHEFDFTIICQEYWLLLLFTRPIWILYASAIL